MQTTKTIDKPYKLPFGGILEHDEKGTSAINSSWQVDELMSVEDDKKDAAAVNSNWRVNESMSIEHDEKNTSAINSNWRVNELMSIEHDEKNTSAINSSWWVDELMSIEHDEKMPRLSTLVDELMNWWAQNMMRKMIRQSTYSLLSFSTRQLANLSTALICPLFSKKFNTMSAFLSINHQPCRKKSILAKVVSNAKRG